MTLRVSAIFLGLGLALAGTAHADDFIGAGDLTILNATRSHVPGYGATPGAHHADQGKSFQVVCFISASGRLSDCQAQAGYIRDTAYVTAVLDTFDTMVVATTGRHSGQSVVGRKVRLTMKVDYGDGPESL